VAAAPRETRPDCETFNSGIGDRTSVAGGWEIHQRIDLQIVGGL